MSLKGPQCHITYYYRTAVIKIGDSKRHFASNCNSMETSLQINYWPSETQQTFAHDTTVHSSCHVQNFVWIVVLEIKPAQIQTKIPLNLNCCGKSVIAKWIEYVDISNYNGRAHRVHIFEMCHKILQCAIRITHAVHSLLSYALFCSFIFIPQWASYQIRKILGCACAGNAGNIFPATDFKGNR